MKLASTAMFRDTASLSPPYSPYTCRFRVRTPQAARHPAARSRVSIEPGHRLVEPAEVTLGARRRDFAWGFVAQVFSSATNFGLALIAGRLLGPSGLGAVVIGFGAYQLVAGLQRAFVTQPIVAHAAPLGAERRRKLAAAGVTIVGASGFAATVAFMVIGVGVGGTVGRALLVFAPWLAVALLQEFWKAVLFQEGSGRAGAASDVLRLGAMCLVTLAIVGRRHEYAVVGAWGVAAAAGLAVAIAAFPMRPETIRASVRLWWRDASKLGRWLGAREVVYQLLTYATLVALALIIGTRDLGGLRSAEALFSPWSLIAAALVLPALPALARAEAVSRRESNRLAVKICVGATALGLPYFLLMVLIGPWLLTRLFGSDFSPFGHLVWPMGVSQLCYAFGFSFNLLLSAQKRGPAAFITGILWALATFVGAIGLGAAYGVTGAAWGMAAGAAAGSVFVVWLSMVRPQPGDPIANARSAGVSGK